MTFPNTEWQRFVMISTKTKVQHFRHNGWYGAVPQGKEYVSRAQRKKHDFEFGKLAVACADEDEEVEIEDIDDCHEDLLENSEL